MFTDKVKLHLSAGNGGDGIVAWRREKYLPKGGPTGGDGGRGGDVVVIADEHVACLQAYRRPRNLVASNGQPGGPNYRSGRGGEDLYIKVPCGTVIRDLDSGDLLVDLEKHGQTHILCRGGKGGKGNARFKSSTNQAPRESTPGAEGQKLFCEFELKLVADIGLVGFPNAGKSSFLRVAARVDAKTGAYPFTTLFPNLGMLEFGDLSRVFIADIPGIIEGASKNKGLGLAFLRHIERCNTLVFILDGSGFAPMEAQDAYRTLRTELEAYDPKLLEKPSLVIFNKVDVEGWEERLEAFKAEYPGHVFCMSTLTGEGLEPVLDQLNAIHSERFASR